MKSRIEKCIPYAAVLGCMAAAMWVVAAFTGQWITNSNPYRSYTLQALAWLNGQLDLGQDYPWLELAIYNGKYFVSFPPFPSYVLLPFAAILGEETPDAILSGLFTALGICYAVYLGRRHGLKPFQAAFWAAFLYLGTGYLFIAMNGYVWFIAQTMAFTLLLMAVVHAEKGQGGLSLGLWACSVGCRPMMLLYLPFLLYLLWKAERQKHPDQLPVKIVLHKWYWIIPPALIGGSYMWLNYARFGSIFEFGHNYLPEFTRTEEGQFSLSYLAENLKNLLRLPALSDDGSTLTFYNMNGMAFWLINPMLICIAALWIRAWFRDAKGNRIILILVPVLTAAYVLILCCHRTLGGWQFGNRYLLDLMPVLFWLTIRFLPQDDRADMLGMPFFALGFALNIVGTICTYNYWI